MARNFCAGCLRDDEETNAELWCSNCAELVCTVCTNVHKRFSPPHMLVPMQQVTTLSFSVPDLSSSCDIHTNKKIALFCVQHDKVICSACMKESHRNCKPIMTIEDAAKDVKNGTAMSDLESRLDTLYQITENILKEYTRTSSDLEDQRQAIKKKIKEARNLINCRLDEIEAELDKELTVKHSNMKENIDRTKQTFQQKHDIINTWKRDIKCLKEHTSEIHIFEALKVLDHKTLDEECTIQDIQGQCTIPNISFNPTITAYNINIVFPSVGTLEVKENKLPLLVKEKDKQSQVVSQHGKISLVNSFEKSKLGTYVEIEDACSLHDNRILLSNRTGKCLFVCRPDGAQCKTIKLKFEPHDVAPYDRTKTLVSGDDSIQIIDMASLKPGKIIQIGYKCHFLQVVNGNIWVNKGMYDLRMLDINGAVQMSVTVKSVIWRFCCSKSDTVYWSTTTNDSVYRLMKGGQEEILYSNPQLEGTSGIAVDHKDNVYVAGCRSNNIHKISSDGYGEVILTAEDGIHNPERLAYNNVTKELLIVNKNYESFRIYKVNGLL